MGAWQVRQLGANGIGRPMDRPAGARRGRCPAAMDSGSRVRVPPHWSPYKKNRVLGTVGG